MKELSGFHKDYFIQTRKEIDTEKRERDIILNIAFAVFGAIAFATIKSDAAGGFLQRPEAVFVAVSVLVVITSLFWVRWKKLNQIADRWFFLRNMLRKETNGEQDQNCLEYLICKTLEGSRYVRKDMVLNLAFSLPVYLLLLIQRWNMFAAAGNRFVVWLLGTVAVVAVIVCHIVISCLLLNRSFTDPFEQHDEDSTEASV